MLNTEFEIFHNNKIKKRRRVSAFISIIAATLLILMALYYLVIEQQYNDKLNYILLMMGVIHIGLSIKLFKRINSSYIRVSKSKLYVDFFFYRAKVDLKNIIKVKKKYKNESIEVLKVKSRNERFNHLMISVSILNKEDKKYFIEFIDKLVEENSIL